MSSNNNQSVLRSEVASLVQAAVDGIIGAVARNLINAATPTTRKKPTLGKKAAGVSKGKAETPTPTKAKTKATKGPKVRAKGEKRSKEEIAKVTEVLFAFIAEHPDLRIEPIGKGLGLSTSELSLPMKKLIADKRVKATGEKRATTYRAKE
jgi:hypothetical protein